MLAVNKLLSFIKRKRDIFIFGLELVIIMIAAFLYAGTLIKIDPNRLQQTGEHNEGATLAILVDQSFKNKGEFPRWNPFMMTGFPHTGDPTTQFLNPIALIPVILSDGITGLKISVFISFIIAALGQLILGYILGFKFLVRIWSALLFMVSGGLAMLWRVGWVGLLIGVVWFPYCLALLIWALDSEKRLPLGLTAISISLLILSGSMYWVLYFLGCSLVIILFKLISTRLNTQTWKGARKSIFRILIIALLTTGLAASSILPMMDTYSHITKQSSPDLEQKGSQKISTAIFNFLIHDIEYFRSNIMGKAASGNWMYIGTLPFLSLFFVPLAYKHSRRKYYILLMATLVVFLFSWHANKHSLFGYVYEKVPFLYQFRFPTRLLIVATSPLIALSGFGLSYLVQKVRQLEGGFAYIDKLDREGPRNEKSFAISNLAVVVLGIILALSTVNTLKINKSFAFAPDSLNEEAEKTLSWLRKRDPGVYYINIGNWPIIWNWMPAAYKNHHKVINFEYARILKSWNDQKNTSTKLKASPKYIIALPGNEPKAQHEMIYSYKNMHIYRMDDALPYAFTIPKEVYHSPDSISPEDVTKIESHWEGPNRVVADEIASDGDSYLVILESNYPGWVARIDGKKTKLIELGNYMGVQTEAGSHRYSFSFEPAKFFWGVGISIFSLIFVIIYMLSGTGWFKKIIPFLKAKIPGYNNA